MPKASSVGSVGAEYRQREAELSAHAARVKCATRFNLHQPGPLPPGPNGQKTAFRRV